MTEHQIFGVIWIALVCGSFGFVLGLMTGISKGKEASHDH